MRWSDIERANALTVTKMPDAMWAWDPADYPTKSVSGSAGSIVIGDAGPEAVITVPGGHGTNWLREKFLRSRSA